MCGQWYPHLYQWASSLTHTEKVLALPSKLFSNLLDGEEESRHQRVQPLLIKERNFISNMRTVYRETEDPTARH